MNVHQLSAKKPLKAFMPTKVRQTLSSTFYKKKHFLSFRFEIGANFGIDCNFVFSGAVAGSSPVRGGELSVRVAVCSERHMKYAFERNCRKTRHVSRLPIC